MEGFFQLEVSVPKLPLGLRPRYIVDGERFLEVQYAIQRRVEAGYCVPEEWFDEYRELYLRMYSCP